MSFTSAELFARSLLVAPGGVHSPVRAFRSVGGTPVFFEKSSGAHLTSVEGKTYIDFCMSFGPLLLGHRDPDVQEQVMAQLHKAWTFGACEPYSLALGEWIQKQLPFVEKLRFVSSGTEAVMSALRVARAATGRKYVLKFDGCYHGHFDPLLVKSGSGLAGIGCSDSAGVSEATASETLVVSLDDDAGLEKVFAEFGSQIAVVALEPMPANYGLLLQRTEFLQKIVKLTRSHGALLLFDEVISGFRIGMQGMAGELNVKPDLVCYGKVMGGGFNVAAYGGRRELMDLVAPLGKVYQAGTLSANPIGMTAGLATLEKAQKLSVHNVLKLRTETFVKDLQAGFAKFEIPMQVTFKESIFWMHLNSAKSIRRIEDIPTGHKESYALFFHESLKRGLYLAPSGYEVGFISLAHTPELLSEASHLIIESAKASFNK